MIVVKERFFKADLCNLIAKGVELYQWRYHHKSDVNNPTHNTFFVSDLWDDTSQDNFFLILWRMIEKHIPFFADCHCWRIIANGQVKGQNGNWHTDHSDKTVIYFPLTWNQMWGGSTFFKIDGSNQEIHYKKNRLIVFDSAIPHYGSSPSVDNVLRVSIAFKLGLKSKQSKIAEVCH